MFHGSIPVFNLLIRANDCRVSHTNSKTINMIIMPIPSRAVSVSHHTSCRHQPDASGQNHHTPKHAAMMKKINSDVMTRSASSLGRNTATAAQTAGTAYSSIQMAPSGSLYCTAINKISMTKNTALISRKLFSQAGVRYTGAAPVNRYMALFAHIKNIVPGNLKHGVACWQVALKMRLPHQNRKGVCAV